MFTKKEYELYFIECHSDIDFWSEQPGVKLNEIQSDGWGEFEHRVKFEADTIEQAKKIALKIYDGSGGVFNVYKNDKLIFTEEDCR